MYNMIDGTLSDGSASISLRITDGSISFIDHNDPPDELIIGACKFIIVLMGCYERLPRDAITSCLLSIVELLRVERQNE